MSSNPPTVRSRFSVIGGMIAAFVVLGVLYLWATPPFEASDELWHFGVIEQIAAAGELPVQAVGVETIWEQEGSQPPLYYLIGALLVKPIDRSDFDVVRTPNPHVQAGVPGASGNKNLVLHAQTHPSAQGTALAVDVLRLFGILCGSVTVAAVYACGRLIAPERPIVALLAAGLTAFNPMFLFISASVNNDVLVTALTSLALWQILILLRDGFSARRSLILAVLIALAALTKLSGLVLLPVVAVAGLWVALRSRNWRGFVLLGVLVTAAWLLLVGWWYVRNVTLYGEWFGTVTMAAVAGTRATAFSLQTLLDEFQGFRFTYWGVFGAVNVMTFRPFYDVMDVISLVAVVGAIIALLRVRTAQARFRLLLLALVILIGTISVIAWTSQTYASQGRLLFPYIAAISPLLALGLVEVVRLVVRRQRIVNAVVVGFVVIAAGFAAVVPFASIAPAYAQPAPLDALPASAEPVYARFGDVALIGYETPDQRYQLGDSVPITVYWQVIDDSTQDLSLYLHAMIQNDGEEIVVGRIDSFPGGGSLQTTTWTPGAIYADHYEILLDEVENFTASPLRIQVGWWDYATGELVTPMNENDEALSSVMLDAGILAREPVRQILDAATAASASFSSVIRLQGYQLDGDQLALLWNTTATPAEDYTVFVQVVNEAGAIVGQGDAPPDVPTHYWHAGDSFVTQHTIHYETPPVSGTYQVLVGWYRPDDFSRLATDAPDNAYPLTDLVLH